MAWPAKNGEPGSNYRQSTAESASASAPLVLWERLHKGHNYICVIWVNGKYMQLNMQPVHPLLWVGWHVWIAESYASTCVRSVALIVCNFSEASSVLVKSASTYIDNFQVKKWGHRIAEILFGWDPGDHPTQSRTTTNGIPLGQLCLYPAKLWKASKGRGSTTSLEHLMEKFS